MAENEKVVEPVAAPEQSPKKKKNVGAGIKEWGRKQIVGLKRAPQKIALFMLAITTVYFLLALFVISQAIHASYANANTTATGICLFITTLLSLLSLVSFLNAFPKRKKPNIFFIVLVFVMIAGMIACDVVYYVQMGNCLNSIADPSTSGMYVAVNTAQPYIIAHIVLLGVSAVVFALLPAYKILINKINTKVELESATENMQGSIDIQED